MHEPRGSEDSSASNPEPADDDAKAEPETPQLLRIENLNVVAASGTYEMTFVLTNDAKIGLDRIQAATVSFDNMSSSFSLSCTSTSQLPYPGQTTTILTWRLSQWSNSTAMLQDTCGDNDSTDPVPSLPWTGDLTLELRGLYRDGKAFKIRATATP